MRSAIITAAALLAACVQAIKVTSPTKNQVVNLSEGAEVKWDTVSTDPAKAHLVLVNMAGGHTPFSQDLGEIDLSKGSYVVKLADVPADSGYQFNFQSFDPLNTGILAQSQQFTVEASDDEPSASASASASASPTNSRTQSSTDAPTSSSSSWVSSYTGTRTSTSSGSSSATASATESASSSISTGAAAPTGRAVQGGSLLALAIGIVAVIA